MLSFILVSTIVTKLCYFKHVNSTVLTLPNIALASNCEASVVTRTKTFRVNVQLYFVGRQTLLQPLTYRPKLLTLHNWTCYLMTTFRCPSDILIRSWLFTARWSTWSGNHLVPCVAELVGSCIPIHAHRCLSDPKYTYPCPGGSGMCTSCERVQFFLVFLDPQTELTACLSNVWAGTVLARDTIDQFGLLFILDLVFRMNHKVP